MEEGVCDRKDDNNEKNDEVKEAEFPDDNPLDNMEEGVSERTDDKNNYEEKEAEFPNGTPPDNMEEGVSEKKMTGIKKLMREKRQNSQMALLLMIWRKV